MAMHERTRKWISKAIAIHGDLYDYSETEYFSTKEPISFICRIHGKVTIPQAGIHLRRVKPGGCQECGWQRLRKHGLCKDCGSQVSNTKKIRCETCSQRKKQQTESRRTRKCKTCENQYKGDPRSAFCSNSCYRSYRDTHDPFVKINCAICGAEKSIRKKRLASNNCCSKECSTELLKRNQHSPRLDPAARVQRARRKYKKESSSIRRKNSTAYRFWRLCKRKWFDDNEQDAWRKRCKAAASGLSNRHKPKSTFTVEIESKETFDSVRVKRKIIKATRPIRSEDPWKLKVKNQTNLLSKRGRKPLTSR